MKSVTHCAIAITATSLSFGTADPLLLALAGIASQIPDIDTTKSTTGMVLYPIAEWFESKFAHREVTHSLLATAILAFALLPIAFWTNWELWSVLVYSYFWGWFADTFTLSGVGAFYPSTARLVIPGNPKARIRPNGSFEYWVLAICICLTILNTNLVTNGGLTEVFARYFFRDASTASAMFFKYSDRQIIAEVEGINNISGERVNAEFLLISATKDNFIGKNLTNGNLYQIGKDQASQIKPSNVYARLGKPLTTRSESIFPKDIFVFELVRKLPANAYLNGSIILDNLSDVRVPLILDRESPISIYAAQIKLSNARPAELESLIGEGFIVDGNVIVKVRSDE
jgi:inner membrane protein